MNEREREREKKTRGEEKKATPHCLAGD